MGMVIASLCAPLLGYRMSLQQFTSEAYSEGHRAAAWQELIAAFDLRSISRPVQQGSHATALLRGTPDRVLVARLTAGEQTLLPLAQKADLPLIFRLREDGSLLRSEGAQVPVPAGALVLLPRCGTWELVVSRGLQAVGLSVRAPAFRGRKTALIDGDLARVIQPHGLAGVLSQMLDTVGGCLGVLSAADWGATEASLAELFLALVSQLAPHASEASGTATQAALLHRLCQSIERRLDDPDLTPARVAQAEGISERYLQKLFEGTGDSFSHYLCEPAWKFDPVAGVIGV